MNVIFIGWVVAVVVVVGLIAQPWKSAANRAPLPLIMAIAMIAWVLGNGRAVYTDLMAQGSWTAATITIGFVPAKAVLYALLAYFMGRTFNTARTTPGPVTQRWGMPALLAVTLVYFLGSDIANNRDADLESHASSTALSAPEVSALIQKIRNGQAAKSEQGAFLGNPLCPPELLAEFASSTDSYWRRAVARNDKISAEIAEKLSQDSDQEVRFMLAFNRELPVPLLSQLAADSSEDVRAIVAWTTRLPDEDYSKLSRDPSAKVREAVAYQQRTSMEDWERLRNDPEKRVRDVANRWAQQ